MRTRWQRFKESDFLYHFLRDPVAYVSFAILMVLVVSAFAAPLIAPHNPYDPTTIDIMDAETPPAWTDDGTRKFMLGTDDMGRDMLSTMLYGMRISIIIGLGAVFLQAFLGIMIGLVSGYIKRLDNILTKLSARLADDPTDDAAIDRMLRIMERRARYLGLDARQNVDVTSDGQPITVVTVGGGVDV